MKKMLLVTLMAAIFCLAQEIKTICPPATLVCNYTDETSKNVTLDANAGQGSCTQIAQYVGAPCQFLKPQDKDSSYYQQVCQNFEPNKTYASHTFSCSS